MSGKGFFAGAAVGLALAFLLVGVASFLPPAGTALQATSTPVQNGAQGALATAKASSTATVTTTTCAAASQGGKACSVSALSSSGTASVAASPVTAQAPTVTAAAGAAAAVAGASSSSSTTTAASVLAAASGASEGGQRGKPGSLLAVLPGESAASLIATISPLLVGFLVAALIYGAYSRRQDSSS